MTVYYPVMLKLEKAKCLVVGGGPIAARKIAGLLEAQAEVVLVCPAYVSSLHPLVEGGQVLHIKRRYEPDDLADVRLVIAATNDRHTNACIAADAQAAGIWVNVADEVADGNVVLPAVIRRGPLVLAVTTSGASPALAMRIRQELEARYGSSYEVQTLWLAQLRRRLQAVCRDEQLRKQLLQVALELPAEQWRPEQSETEWTEQIEALHTRAGQEKD